MSKTTNNTVSTDNMEFIESYLNEFGESYGELDTIEEQEQLDAMKDNIQTAMIAMAKHIQELLHSQQQEQNEPDIKVLLGEIQSLKSQLKPKSTVAVKESQVQQPVPKAGKGTHNTNAYNMWVKEYYAEHPGIKALPPNLWKNLCAEDPSFRAKYQAKADEFNAENGRVSTKGSTRAVTGPNEYTKTQQYAKAKIAEYGYPKNIFAQVMKSSGWVKGSKMTCADVAPAIDAFLESYEIE